MLDEVYEQIEDEVSGATLTSLATDDPRQRPLIDEIARNAVVHWLVLQFAASLARKLILDDLADRSVAAARALWRKVRGRQVVRSDVESTTELAEEALETLRRANRTEADLQAAEEQLVETLTEQGVPVEQARVEVDVVARACLGSSADGRR